MFDRIFGRYLLEKGKLSDAQLAQAYQVQESKRAKLGVIAVTEKLMTVAQAEEINALQAMMDKRFGDLAVERGYLSNIQVGRLLSLQEDEFLTFTSAIVERGFMSLEELNNSINEYQKEMNFDDSAMESLKRGDLNQMIPLFLDTTDEEYVALFTYGIKNFYRLVDTHVAIGRSYTTKDISDECLSYQTFSGDVKATIALLGNDADLQRIAKSYTKEEFIETREDALDAMCELINCIDGLYATDKSKKGQSIELDPPLFQTKFARLLGEDLHVMPIRSCDGEIYLVVSVNSDVTVK